MTPVKPSDKLPLHDRLSRLTFDQACKLVGEEGRKLILQGSKREVNLDEDVFLGGDLFRVTLRKATGKVDAIATLTMMADRKDRLHWNCDCHFRACEHVGAMFSVLLENKVSLGLAAAPPERETPAEMDEEALVERALADREERARNERMKVRSTNSETPWTDYTVTSLVSGKTYHVALRGLERGQSYCSCPDFRTNTLGTCKHLMKVAGTVLRKFKPAQLKKPFRWQRIELVLQYGEDVSLQLVAPARLSAEVDAIVRPLPAKPLANIP